MRSLSLSMIFCPLSIRLQHSSRGGEKRNVRRLRPMEEEEEEEEEERNNNNVMDDTDNDRLTLV